MAAAMKKGRTRVPASRALSREEEQRLVRAYRAGDLRARDRLVAANMPFVTLVARRYLGHGQPLEDLVQEGAVGLTCAIESFDPDRGTKLISYAAWHIRSRIGLHVLGTISLVKIGTTQAQRKLFFSLRKTRRKIAAESGPEAADDLEVIAKTLNVRPKDVEQMLARGADLSLDRPGNDAAGSAARFVDLLEDGRASPEEAYARAEHAARASRTVKAAVAVLPDRERFIIERRVMNEEPMTLEDIGRHFGVSRRRVQQIETRAKDRLREIIGPERRKERGLIP